MRTNICVHVGWTAMIKYRSPTEDIKQNSDVTTGTDTHSIAATVHIYVPVDTYITYWKNTGWYMNIRGWIKKYRQFLNYAVTGTERSCRTAQYWQCLLKSSAMCSTALCLQSSGSNEGENLDPPLQDCTIEERGVVRFLWAQGVKPVEIHRRTLAQCGQSTMSQRKVYEWVERFKSGRTRVTDEGRSGRPSTSRSRKASSPQEYRN